MIGGMFYGHGPSSYCADFKVHVHSLYMRQQSLCWIYCYVLINDDNFHFLRITIKKISIVSHDCS